MTATLQAPPTVAARTAATAFSPVAGSRDTEAGGGVGVSGVGVGGGGADYGSAGGVAACSRAPADTGPRYAIPRIELIVPVPRRPLTQHLRNEVNNESGYPYLGDDAGGNTQPPPLPSADAVIVAFAVEGSRNAPTQARDGGGSGRCSGGGGSAVCGVGGGGGSGLCNSGGGGGVGGGGVGGGHDGVSSGGGGGSTGRFEQARLRAPPGFEGVALAPSAMVRPVQGGDVHRVQQPPLPAAAVVRNAFEATISAVPQAGHSYPTPDFGVVLRQAEAQQRVQMDRQGMELHQQGLELELRRYQLQRQKVLLQRRRREFQRQQEHEAQAAQSLVFWGSGGLLMPVARTLGSPGADSWRAARAAMVPPGLSRG